MRAGGGEVEYSKIDSNQGNVTSGIKCNIASKLLGPKIKQKRAKNIFFGNFSQNNYVGYCWLLSIFLPISRYHKVQ